jgi:TolB-like protein
VATGRCSRTYRFGSCTLDLDRGTLERDGALVPIRAKTYGLLAHLATNAGRVLGKDALLDAIWPDVTVTEDSLTQAIRDLRRAIGDERGEFVRTVPRRGYLFAIPLADPPATAGAASRVAVLPFRNLTGVADDGILLDGLVEEITNGLARFKTVTVIARHSAFAFRPEERAGLAEVGARLGADYLVEGSGRRTGAGFALTAAIAAAQDGRQLWGESFECAREDLLALPQVIAGRVVQRLVSNIETAVLARTATAPTASLSAFEHLTRGIALLRSYGEGVNERGRDHLLRAIEIDPACGLAHAYLGLAELMIADFSAAPVAAREAAKARAMAAVHLAPEDARCLRLLSFFRGFLGEHAAAEETARRAHALNPHDADTLLDIGEVLTFRGRAAEALDWIDRAIVLNPLHPTFYRGVRSIPLYLLGRYEESLEELRLLPRLNLRQEFRMAATLAMLGRMQEACTHLDRVEAVAPGWPHLDAAAWRFERAEDARHLIDGVKAALAWRAQAHGGSLPE